MYLYTLKILHFISKLNFVAHGVKLVFWNLFAPMFLMWSDKSFINWKHNIFSSIKARGGGGGGGGGGKSFKKPKKLLFPKSIHFLTTEILLPLIYL